MKAILFILVVPVLMAAGGCSSEPSNNPYPRRTYNAETGNFEGPSPMPGANGQTSRRY